jgi:TetR/AcrR family transcriptional regulator, transcriptional repressor for nem operon
MATVERPASRAASGSASSPATSNRPDGTQRPAATLTRKGELTRARITAAASTAIASHGVAASTIDEVRSLAGVSSSQLYHYFADKDDLVRAVIDMRADLAVDTTAQVWSGISSIADLRTWRDQLIAGVEADGCRGGCPLGSLSGQLAETDPDARADLAEAFRRWQLAMQVGLESMKAQGILAADADAYRLSTAMLVALEGGLMFAQLERTTRALAIGLDAAIDVVEGYAV